MFSQIKKKKNLTALLAEITAIKAEGRSFWMHHFCCRLDIKWNDNLYMGKKAAVVLAWFVRTPAQPHEVCFPPMCCLLPLGVILLFIWSLQGCVFGGIFQLA